MKAKELVVRLIQNPDADVKVQYKQEYLCSKYKGTEGVLGDLKEEAVIIDKDNNYIILLCG